MINFPKIIGNPKTIDVRSSHVRIIKETKRKKKIIESPSRSRKVVLGFFVCFSFVSLWNIMEKIRLFSCKHKENYFKYNDNDNP